MRMMSRSRGFGGLALGGGIAAIGAIVAFFALLGSSGGATARATTVAAPSGALALQSAFVRVVRAVSPSVVQIETGQGLGSGVVFDGKGNIVTNAHVVGTATRFTVTTSSGKRIPGTLVGRFEADDLAVVHVGTKLSPMQLADSAKLRVGDVVLAIGNPLGLRSSVTQGIVSSTSRTVSEGGGVALPSVIQTSAAINPGNSGGALVDASGAVIGVPTLAATDPELGGSAPGIGFAISSNSVKRVAPQLADQGRVASTGRAYLGVELGPLQQGGAAVVRVVPGGPAAKAGLREGDILVAIDGTPVTSADDVAVSLAGHKPGDTVTLDVRHQDGSTAKVKVTLGELPAG
jgi:putative serine protease PepD